MSRNLMVELTLKLRDTAEYPLAGIAVRLILLYFLVLPL
jgi:hypothetical protein